MTCDQIAKIVEHSEDLVHRTIRKMEIKYYMKILRDRNDQLYIDRRKQQ